MVGELTALPRPRRWIWALRGRTGKTGKERAREGKGTEEEKEKGRTGRWGKSCRNAPID